jgi:thiol-disulfide isomerase/thioredoxin
MTIVLITVSARADAINWETSYDTALEKAKKDKKLVMVDVYADWCGWCKKLDRDTYSDKTVQETLVKNFVAVKINPEKSKRDGELAKQFGTHGYPHIVFLDDSGKKFGEISGYQPAGQFQKSLDALLAARVPANAKTERTATQQPVSVPPPQTVSPPPLDPSKLTLQGIMTEGHNHEAVINGISVRVGDSIEGAKILAIDSKTVRLYFQGSEILLRLP